ncbi:MAG: hypothetical protein WA416_15815 [Candidatus Sulfotelmatobacter sp.]
MQHRILRSFQYFCLPALVLCLALAAQASGPHKFSAFYQIVNVTDHGDNVEVRVALRVFNNSGAKVTGATISLVSCQMTLPEGLAFEWEKDEVPFTNVTLPFNSSSKTIAPPLVGTFRIPGEEYALWKKQTGPRFVIAYQDAAGEQQNFRIDMIPAP